MYLHVVCLSFADEEVTVYHALRDLEFYKRIKNRKVVLYFEIPKMNIHLTRTTKEKYHKSHGMQINAWEQLLYVAKPDRH